MNLGKAIKTSRLKRELTQGVLASMAGITQAYLSSIENNKKKPNMRTVETICGCLSIPLPFIMWQGLEEKDIEPEKLDMFRLLNPSVCAFIYDVS